MPPYHHGIKTVEVTEGTRPLTVVSTSVIGLIATAADADAVAFPLNTPVEITDLDGSIGKAGVEGTLAKALIAIRDQTRTIVQVIRVAHSAVANELTANVVGTTDANGLRTGAQALLSCQALFGHRPRIIGAPGLDNQAVATALATIAQKLGAMAYVTAVGATNAAAIGYRANFAARELMLIAPDVKALNAAGAVVDAPATAYAMGLRAKIDQEQGWHKTLSNVAINGVLGTARPIEFDLSSMANDAGLLNAADVTTVIRNDGFRFWGSRTASDEPKFAFESAVRTAQIIRDTISEGLMWAIDKPLTPGLVKDILSTINHKFAVMKAQGYILGANAWFDPAKNPPAELSNGILDIDYDYTPVPPLEALNLTQRITDRYFVNFANGIAA